MSKALLLNWLESHPAKNVAEPVQTIEHFLHIINAPEDLRYWLPVFDNTRIALQRASSPTRQDSADSLDELFGFSSSELILLLDHICHHSLQLSSMMPQPAAPKSDSTRHPYTGYGILERPLYAALMQYPNYEMSVADEDSANMKGAYYALLAGYIAAYRKLSRDENNGNSVPPAVRMSACCGAQRALSKIADIANIIGAAGTLQTNILWYADQPTVAMCKSIGSAKRSSDCELTRALGLVFEQAFLAKGPRKTGPGGKNQDLSAPVGFWFNELFDLDIAEHTEPLDQGPPKTPHTLHRGNGGENKSAGHFPPIEGGGDTVGLVSDDDLRRPGVTVAGQLDRFAMSNQHLPHNVHDLAIRELLPLLEQFQFYRALSYRDEALTALEISLWTGQSIESIAKLKLTQDVVTAKTFGYLRQSEKQSGQWFIPVSPPAYDTLVSKFSDTGCRPIVRHVVLPDILNIGARLKRRDRPFRLTAEALKKHAREILRELDPTKRLTVTRVQRFLKNFLCSHYQREPASIQLLFGGDLQHQTRLHYTTRRLTDLEQIYRDGVVSVTTAIRELGCDAYADLSTPDAKIALSQPRLSSDSVGSRLCPETETISALVSDLKRPLDSTDTLRESRAAIIDYHNRYTLYTFLLMQFATGYRAVIDPILRLTDIDPITQTAIVRDKELPRDSNARLIPVVDVLQEQLVRYERHREVIQPLALELSDSEPNRHKVQNNFFWLDSDASCVVELRPLTFHEQFSDTYPYPVNASRRYIRTKLIERSCPTESVDAFMGHWQHGQQPYGQYSTLPLLDVIDPVRHELTELMQDLGFTVINSALRRVL